MFGLDRRPGLLSRLDTVAEELAGGLISTDQLRVAFETASGTELSDFLTMDSRASSRDLFGLPH